MKSLEDMTMAEHAEAWACENDLNVPEDQESKEWNDMYLKWIEFAFSDFCETLED